MNYLAIAALAAFVGFGTTSLAADTGTSEKRSGASEGKTLGQDSQAKADPQSDKRQSDCGPMQGLQARSQQQRPENQPASASQDQPQRSQDQTVAGTQTVIGEFVKMEGDNYVVKDASGKSVCIPSNYSTFIDGTFITGDTIEARLAADGSAARIRRVIETRTAAGQGPGESSGQMSSESRPDQDLTAKQNVPIVKGELLLIQGEFYTVKDASGNEVRLHVNKDTKMDSAFKVGDKIEAERTSSGHALYIKKTQESGSRRDRE
jgi:hypothetical protein